jgi:hypothetical protein
MRRMGVVLLVLIGILVIACGSSGSSEPTESGLRERAEAFATAASNEKWIEVHRFYSPEFQEQCPVGEFAIFLGMGMTMLKGMMGIDKDEKLEIHVTAVTVDGLNGTVTAEAFYNGEPLDFFDSGDEEPVQWAFIDGQWRYVHDEECPSF